MAKVGPIKTSTQFSVCALTRIRQMYTCTHEVPYLFTRRAAKRLVVGSRYTNYCSIFQALPTWPKLFWPMPMKQKQKEQRKKQRSQKTVRR